VNSLGIRNVHEARHQLDGFEISDALDKKLYSLLSFISEENVRVFIDDVNYSGIFNVFEILQGFLIGFL
jgi:hypothetical protein